MKLDGRQAAAFCRDPGGCRVVLLHGDDEGLIRERAQTLTRQIAGSLNDPFRISELTREGWGQIPSEMAALSMLGGRRVVLVRDATDAALTLVSEAVRGPGDALLILEATGLAKGKLRSFVEGLSDGASIACYPDEGRALMETIGARLKGMGVRAEPEALSWLGGTLGGGRAVVRSEVEKLALLAGPGGAVTLETAQACVGEAASAFSDDALLEATSSDVRGADASLQAAILDGLNGVALMRMALGHLQKMHQAKLRVANGMSGMEAVRAMRPPVFFKAASTMNAALALWSADALLRAIEEARRVEMSCKQTGSKPELLAQRFVQNLSRAAYAQMRR